MSTIDLQHTKRRLAIMFAFIVFLVSFLLEMSYFTIRYYNLSYLENKEFSKITDQFRNEFTKDSRLFSLFITEGIKFKPPRDDFGRSGKPDQNRGFRFMNFIIISKSGTILAQNLGQDLDMKLNLEMIPYNTIFSIHNVLLRKIDISFLGDEYKDIVFIKKQGYDFENYIQDIFFFFLVTVLFSVFFYFIGYFFVNKNLKPVEETFSDMNDFIHNANHELKTPIAVISSNLQLMKAMKLYDEALVETSVKEIQTMDHLLLELSNLSDLNTITQLQNVNLKQEIENILLEYQKIIDGKKLHLEFLCKKNINLTINKQYFYIFFTNLLRNAIKYNFEEGKINIILDKNKIVISNTGPGIKNEDIPYIFDRFFKAEKSRNSEGFGIGLSLVKKISEMYHWEISVSSNEQSTVFEIKLKK